MSGRGHDRLLFTAVLILVGLGVVMVYSASAIRAQERFGDPAFFLKKQILWALIGVTGMVWLMGRDYRGLRPFILPLLFLAFGMLVLVLVPGIGVKVNGARRWLRLLGFSFQPAELAKLALVGYLARLLADKEERVREFGTGILPPLTVCAVFFLLVALQPNYGTAVVILLTGLTMLFAAGARVTHLAALGVGVLPPLALVFWSVPHVRGRILALLDPAQASPKVLYQALQSQVALGQGGSLGRGLGEGMQKLYYLPEPHTDFIFAIVGEELGFAGAALVVAFFALLLWRGTRIALGAPDRFGALLALGITFVIVGQAAINFGVVVGLLPTTGLPLPLVSFGGSSLVVTLFGLGVLLSISQAAGMGSRVALPPRPLPAGGWGS
ncbi:MAG: putative lipid II flippase FtsW [candidate division NC10 bacterium]|nr:putative lipid II flippase FtsW [candidate division NC10 bacterium]